MPHSFLKLRAAAELCDDMDAQELAMMAAHLACLKSRRDAGEVMVLVPGADADPVDQKRGFACEVYPMRAITRAATTSA